MKNVQMMPRRLDVPWRKPEPVDRCLSFDGTDDYVLVPADASLAVGLTGTIEAWVKLTDTTVEDYIMMNTGGLFNAVSQGGDRKIAFYAEGWNKGTTLLNNNTWYHIVWTWGNTVLKGYVNGVEDASIAIGFSLPNIDTYFGYRLDNTNSLNGQLDEVRIYSRALAAPEILENFRRGRTGSPQPYDKTGLVGWWHMDEGAGATIKDFSGNSNDGTITGATWVKNECVLDLSMQDQPIGNTLKDRSGYGNDGTITGATWVKLPSGLWVLSFDGTDDDIVVASSASLPVGTSARTYEIWAYLKDYTAYRDLMYMGNPLVDHSAFNLMVMQTTGQIYLDGVSDDNASGVVLPLNSWHKLTVTFSGNGDGTSIIYLDATPLHSQVHTVIDTSVTNLWIGANTGSQSWWNGYVSLAKVLNRALSPAEISAKFQSELHLFGV